MGSNDHDFISDVSLSGFMKMFYKQGFKARGVLLFYFPQQAISERGRAVFIAGRVYGGNLAVAGGRNTHPLRQRNDWELLLRNVVPELN